MASSSTALPQQQPTDFHGDVIEPGCRVVYPKTSGSSLRMIEGIVTDIEKVPGRFKLNGEWVQGLVPRLVIRRTHQSSYSGEAASPITKTNPVRINTLERVVIVAGPNQP